MEPNSKAARAMGLVSDGFGFQAEAAPWQVEAPGGRRGRWKREDCELVKHDKVFSDWKVLVGPSDWKEHASGKEGVERCHLHNLPAGHLGPGVYELGITAPAWLPVKRRSKLRALRPEDVVVVYVGQADNIRQRLQRYGQAGAHLEGSRSTRMFVIKNGSASYAWKSDFSNFEDRRMNADESRNIFDERTASADLRGTGEPLSPEHSGQRSPRGPRLFSEVFALGCSIAFRWAVTDSRCVAERVEDELLEAFDYAWNKGANGYGRSRDVLAKIVMDATVSDNAFCSGDTLKKNRFVRGRKRVGIQVALQKPTESRSRITTSDRTKVGNFLTMLRKSPQLLTVGGKAAKSCEFTKLDIPVERCGVLLENGRPCSSLSLKGRKTCLLHQSTKSRSQRRPIQVAHSSHSPRQGSTGDSTIKPEFRSKERAGSSPLLRGLALCLPFLNQSQPQQIEPEEPKRPGSLSFTTWLKESENRRAKSIEWMEAAEEKNAITSTVNSAAYSMNMKTYPTDAKRSITYGSPLPTCKEARSESACKKICGLRLEDGSVCTTPPRPNRKHCHAHKGMRVNGQRSLNNKRTLNYSRRHSYSHTLSS